MKKILTALLSCAIVVGTMTAAAFAQTTGAALIAGEDRYVDELPSAFTEAGNPNKKQVLMAKDWTGDITIDYPGFSSSFYINGYTLDGTLTVTDASIINLYGIEPGNKWAGNASVITDGIYQNSTANVNVNGDVTVQADENGYSLVATAGKIIVYSDDVTFTDDIKVTGEAILKITAGTYNGEFEIDTPTNLEITGGTFTLDPSAYLPAGFKAVKGADDMYTIEAPTGSLDDLTKDADGKYVLSTPTDIVRFRTVMSKQNIAAGTEFILANDINMEGITLAPAGNDTMRFSGIFDGQNKTISNVTIDGGNDTYVAFFGNASGATIKNLTLENVTVNGGQYTAGIVGRTRNTTITNCHVIGDIDISGTISVGAIVGGGVTNITESSVVGTAGSSITGQSQVGAVTGLSSAGTTNVDNNSAKGVEVTASQGSAGGIIGIALVNNNGNNLSVSGNAVEEVKVVSGDSSASAVVVGNVITGGKGTVSLTDNATKDSTVEIDGNVSTNMYGGVEGDENITIPVAKIGTAYYNTLSEAVKFAAENATESAPVTIQLLEGTFTENITLPSNISYVTFKGAPAHKTVLKNSSVGHSGGMNAVKTALTFDGIVFDNSNINLTAIYENTKIENMTINNCKFLNVTGKTAVSINTNSLPNLVGFTFTNNVIDGVTGGSFSGLVLRAAPTGDIVITGNEISNVAWNAIQLVNLTADANVTITDNILSSGASEGVLNIYNAKCGITLEDNTINTLEGQPAIAGFAPVAKIGDKQYTTLAGAVADVKDNETIILLKDIETTNIANNGVAYTVDLNGFTLTPVGKEGDAKHYFNWGFENLTIKNGVLNLNEAGASDSMFTFYEDDVLNIENVTIIREKYVDYTTYIMNMQAGYNNQVANFIDSEIIIGDGACGYDFIINHSNTSEINFIRTNIECGNEFIVGYGGATFTDCIIDAPKAVLVWYANKPIVINGNSDVNVAYVVFNTGATLTVDDTSKVEAINIYCYDKTTGSGALVVGENATVHAENIDNAIINNPDSSIEGVAVSKADTIYIQYRRTDVERNADGTIKTELDGDIVDTREDADTYEIILAGYNSEKINELASADITFNFVGTPYTGAAMDYTVSPAKGVTLTQLGDSDRFMFNYNGIDKYEETGAAIVIGTIEVSGYGKYYLGTDATVTTNAVYATEIKDNIVEGFDAAGKLVVNVDMDENDQMVGEVSDVELVVPTRELMINITFPNAVENKAYEYQQMTVKVFGGDLDEALVIGLGETPSIPDVLSIYTDKTDCEVEVVFENGAYEIEIDELLTLSNTYTVEVSGEGYRTARYTVTMTADKTLNFWNNVKDNAINVEEGKDSSAKNVTFLAGDIVKDSVINIYDLSAVVSYFGEIDLVEDNKTEYAKYDLNRDGKIDSKDVAYVLVSWGK